MPPLHVDADRALAYSNPPLRSWGLDEDLFLQCCGSNPCARCLGHFWPWLAASGVRILSLLTQEIKAQEDNFPYALAEQHGYEAHIVGQKGFNGVAVLTKGPAEIVLDHLPGDEEDTQARYLEVDYEASAWQAFICPMAIPSLTPSNGPISSIGWRG